MKPMSLICAAASLVLFTAGLVLPIGPSSAQQYRVDPEMLTIASKLRVSEADFRVGCYMPGLSAYERRRCVNDAAIIAWVIRARAEVVGITWVEMARRYAPSATGVRPPQSRRHIWIQQLSLDGSEPPAWGSLVRLSWERHRLPLWRRIVAEMEHVLTRWPNPCEGGAVPEQWGGACTVDGRPENPRGVCDLVPPSWERLDCGRAVNAAYLTPRSLPARLAKGRHRWYRSRRNGSRTEHGVGIR